MKVYKVTFGHVVNEYTNHQYFCLDESPEAAIKRAKSHMDEKYKGLTVLIYPFEKIELVASEILGG